MGTVRVEGSDADAEQEQKLLSELFTTVTECRGNRCIKRKSLSLLIGLDALVH